MRLNPSAGDHREPRLEGSREAPRGDQEIRLERLRGQRDGASVTIATTVDAAASRAKDSI